MITSCGICKLGLKWDCSLYIKNRASIYKAEGTGINNHGDTYAEDGFCSAVRVASTKGLLKDNIYYANSFNIIGKSE